MKPVKPVCIAVISASGLVSRMLPLIKSIPKELLSIYDFLIAILVEMISLALKIGMGDS